MRDCGKIKKFPEQSKSFLALNEAKSKRNNYSCADSNEFLQIVPVIFLSFEQDRGGNMQENTDHNCHYVIEVDPEGSICNCMYQVAQ